MSNFEVLTDHRMGSDHAPILCTLSLSKAFRIDSKPSEPRFNFKKADWKKYGVILDEMIGSIGIEDNISDLNEIFCSLIVKSANQNIPKRLNSQINSYPPHIVEIIKMRKEIRKKKKKVSLDELSAFNTEYNRLTRLKNKAIQEYTEKR